jgi:hypothetical protein
MTRGAHSGVVRVSALFAVLVAALLLGSRCFQPFGYAAIPFCWPGLFILGADETQERYGYWGEIIMFWLLSLPCIVAYAWLLCRWWQRRRDTPDIAEPDAGGNSRCARHYDRH